MKKFLIFLCVAVFLGMVPQAQALTLTFTDAYYVGRIQDGIPSNPTDEVGYINFLRTVALGGTDTDGSETYYRSNNSFTLPIAILGGSLKIELSDPPATGENIFNSTGFQYILGKYDAGNAGAYVWFLDSGFSGEITVPMTAEGQYGLSHISAYNPKTSVPEPAALFFLAAGLLGLAGVARKKFKK